MSLVAPTSMAACGVFAAGDGVPWLETLTQYLGQFVDLAFFVEVSIIYLLIYYFIRFCEGTRGAGILKGLAILILIAAIGLLVVVKLLNLERMQFLLTIFTPTSIMALIIILQPELRRGLVRLSQTPIFGEFLREEHEILDEVLKAVFRLAKNRVGALIAIEREDPLTSYAERGTPIDAEVRTELLTTIFYPGTDLHDGAVIIQRGRLAAAGCLFPLSENQELGTWAGTRHRAAVGLSEECDAITLVVSEERGEVSLCVKGRIHRDLDKDELLSELRIYYAQEEPDAEVEGTDEALADPAAADAVDEDGERVASTNATKV
ncbi:MAG: diadenylate cyclase CdaA [Planctomycetota bacterium]